MTTPWLIYFTVGALIASAFYHANPDLPAIVWGIGYVLPMASAAICLAMATEKPRRRRRR